MARRDSSKPPVVQDFDVHLPADLIMVLPVLYSFRRCPYAMRARLALLVSGQRCELREVLLRDKPAEMLAVSPKGTVPVLVDIDGQVIDESREIMLWALRRNDPGRWLATEEESLHGACSLIDACDAGFKQALDRYKYPTRFTDVDADVQRELGAAFLRQLQSRLQDQVWLGGEQPRLADYAIMPFVRQYSMVEPAWFQQQAWPELHRWLRALTGSPLFAQVMTRQPPWRSGESGPVFPAEQAKFAG